MSEIVQLGRRLRAGQVTCESVVRASLEAIRRLEPSLNAFITVTEDQALLAAKALDVELRAGRDRGLLHGIPVAYKDCIDTAGVLTTVGTEIFCGRVPSSDAEIVRRLSTAGAIMLGKNNMNELAAGGPGGYNKYYGPTRNPWHLEHESGGSSSGTGAAVAAGLCPVGIGTDSGGSIRGPASYMGIVGLRPTFGSLDMVGIFPRAPSLDTCGPLAASALDAGIVFDALVGELSRASIDETPMTLGGVRLGVVEGFSLEHVQDEVGEAVVDALRVFERLGAEVVSLTLPELGRQATLEEASTVLVYEFAREFGKTYLAIPDAQKFGPVVRQDMRKASAVSETAYRGSMQFKRRYSECVGEALRRVDALVTPTMERTAPLASHPDLSGAHRRFTLPVSFAGLPAVSLRCGFDGQGLPIGLQLFGAAGAEHKLLAVAHAYECATSERRARPRLYFDQVAAI